MGLQLLCADFDWNRLGSKCWCYLGRNPDGRRDLSANHDNPTGNTMAPTARSGGSRPAALRRLDVWATSAPPSSPPEPDRATTAADRNQAPPNCDPPESDRATADRDQAPLTTRAKQNADKRRRAPDQDVDRPTRKQMQRKLRARQDQPMDSTL